MTIRVRCLGHIKTSVGSETVEIRENTMNAGELIESLRKMGAKDPHLGFTRFNTLLIVNGQTAFTAAADDRKLVDGDEVLLVPFSHGG
ncbi:MAG: MoaD/ThiS family protein [Thaumarchaeota archaeon]|nr:MoaD/ThiS family protein [Nitrososphaerota archaeon]